MFCNCLFVIILKQTQLSNGILLFLKFDSSMAMYTGMFVLGKIWIFLNEMLPFS